MANTASKTKTTAIAVTRIRINANTTALVRITSGDEDNGTGIIVELAGYPVRKPVVGQVVTYAHGDYDLDRQQKVLPVLARVQHRANALQIVRNEIAEGLQQAMVFNPARRKI